VFVDLLLLLLLLKVRVCQNLPGKAMVRVRGSWKRG